MFRNGLYRGFASKVSLRAARKQKLKANLKAYKKENGNKPLPYLKDTLRKLYMKTHPDLFHQYPTERDCNEASYKELLGILDAVEKQGHERLPDKKLVLPFFVRGAVSDTEFSKVVFNARITGGNCKTVLQESLGDFFVQCGFTPVFQWSPQSWGASLSYKDVQALQKEEEDRQRGENKESRHEESISQKRDKKTEYDAPKVNTVKPDPVAPAFTGTSSRNDMVTIDKVLEEWNDVLQVIACRPWLSKEDEEQAFLNNDMLAPMEERGFQIRSKVEQIWAGQRNTEQLLSGLNADSAQLVQRILMHVRDIEIQLKQQTSAQ